ncbi:hypothetical protein [Streptomyces sp. H27-C3]|uniref:hypothetical protein n=1 Tax=Streptomyces sp. H27-C3 TaxID=3046305 RepID=UPI0024B99C5E|nr:hypothetical protein [Streptomyces sp. H27-C3]MDJ0464468.1 hypothetical protein [Streptomyces sp. H27-C3]
MRPAQLLTGTALTAAVTLLYAGPSYAGETGSLEVYPASVAPGANVTVNTTACGVEGGGTGDAKSLGAGDFDLYPGTHKEVVIGEFTVPAGTLPGTYGIAVACDNGKTANGDLTVTGGAPPSPTHPVQPTHPTGHVKTGVGGSVGPDTSQIAAGVAVLAATAVGGTWFLRRRASGPQDS